MFAGIHENSLMNPIFGRYVNSFSPSKSTVTHLWDHYSLPIQFERYNSTGETSLSFQVIRQKKVQFKNLKTTCKQSIKQWWKIQVSRFKNKVTNACIIPPYRFVDENLICSSCFRDFLRCRIPERKFSIFLTFEFLLWLMMKSQIVGV